MKLNLSVAKNRLRDVIAVFLRLDFFRLAIRVRFRDDVDVWKENAKFGKLRVG